MYPFAVPPDQVTVSPLERVTENAVAASGGGLVMTGIAGRVIEALKAGTSAPPGALRVMVPGAK